MQRYVILEGWLRDQTVQALVIADHYERWLKQDCGPSSYFSCDVKNAEKIGAIEVTGDETQLRDQCTTATT